MSYSYLVQTLVSVPRASLRRWVLDNGRIESAVNDLVENKFQCLSSSNIRFVGNIEVVVESSIITDEQIDCKRLSIESRSNHGVLGYVVVSEDETVIDLEVSFIRIRQQ